MNVKKGLLVAGAVSAVGLSSLVGIASAQGDGGPGTNGLVDKIASRFNLNKADVQKVFDENRSAHEAEMKARVEDRLSQAVTDGKITADQKTKIIAKHEELRTFMESLKDKTESERHTAVEAKRTELEKWAADNGIPEEYAHFGPGRGFRHGPRSDMTIN